jgi:4-hydroxyacetophenone monooxygenase
VRAGVYVYVDDVDAHHARADERRARTNYYRSVTELATLSVDDAVADADVPVLLVSVAQLTGDLSLLRDEFRPDASNLFDPNAGISPEHQAQARRLAADALRRHLESGRPPAPAPDDAALRRMIAFLVGDEPVAEYEQLLREELAPAGTDPRAPSWRAGEVAPGRAFSVAVVGAGMSGLAAAYRFTQVGIPVTVFEKNSDVGGTWFENTYPGCRVDVPNHLYSYSFAQTTQWPEFFSAQGSLLDYFRWCADTLHLREHIRFGTEVCSAEFDEERRVWRVHVSGPDGEQSQEFDALCSAVGQLNRPNFPDIPGRDDFRGVSFHSARWRHDVELRGKRVIVIGTGASAAQFIPAVADQARELVVFQRTAPWLAPTPNYHDRLSDDLRRLIEVVPDYVRWDRLWLFWRTHEGLLPAAKVDPSWETPGASVSMQNEFVRQLLTGYLRAEFPEDDLFEKVVPDYPPIAKRIVRDNGIWARTLRRDNVRLITDKIDRITERGVRTVDGTEYDCDVLIYGTGFQASNFLTPMRITGRGGVEIHERWSGDARAYLGITVPEFPNLFLMYGPNTNIVINGSIIYFSECEAHYIVECVRMLLERDKRWLEVRGDVHDAYNAEIDEANRSMAWGASTVNTWYKNARGRITQNWPFSLLEYWRRTREPNPDDYVLR